MLGLDVYLMTGEQLSVGKHTRKGVTGYDLTSLIVGSEGTLAVVADHAQADSKAPRHAGVNGAVLGPVHRLYGSR